MGEVSLVPRGETSIEVQPGEETLYLPAAFEPSKLAAISPDVSVAFFRGDDQFSSEELLELLLVGLGVIDFIAEEPLRLLAGRYCFEGRFCQQDLAGLGSVDSDSNRKASSAVSDDHTL